MRFLTDTKQLQVVLAAPVATNECAIITGFADDDGTTLSEDDGAVFTTSDTPVVAIDSPAGGSVRHIKSFELTNIDTAPIAVTINIVDTSGPTTYPGPTITLPVGYQIIWLGDEFAVFTSTGARVSDSSGGGGGGSVTVSGWNATSGTFGGEYGSWWQAVGLTANIDAFIGPKGLGAFGLGALPDGTAMGGNVRGKNAVDLQIKRTVATQVASGDYSVAVGNSNSATGLHAAAVGTGCHSYGQRSTAIGYQSYATQDGSTAIGYGANALSVNCTAVGCGAYVAPGYTAADAFGYSAIADRNNSFAIGQTGLERQIIHVADGTDPTDAATVGQMTTFFNNLSDKAECAYCSTSALPANTYSNGSSGVGATLTGNVNGPLVVDGITLAVGAVGLRILVGGETSTAHNGWYTLTQLGVVAVSPYILTRATDSDQGTEIGPGYITPVRAPSALTPGVANDGKVFISAAPSPFTVGTDGVTFGISGNTYTAGTGLTLTGTAFSVNYGSSSTTACVGNDSRLSDARTPVGTALNSALIWVGSAGNIAAAVAVSGDVTITNAGVTAIGAGKVTLAMQANMATASVVYRKTAGSGAPEVNTLATLKTDLGLTGTNSGDQTITLTGDVTGSGTGSFATTLATAQPAVHTWALTQTFTVAPVFTDVAGTQTAIGLAKRIAGRISCGA